MAQKFLTSIDHNKLESLNFRLQNLATAPGSPVSGQTYFDTGSNETRTFVSSWESYMFKSGGTFTGRIETAPGSTTTAGGLKLTSGPLKTTPVVGDAGSIEFDGSSLSFIDSTGVRRTLGVSGAGIQSVTLNQPAAGFTITQTGTASDPIYTFALNASLAAIQGLSTNGFVRRTGTNTFTTDATISLGSQVSGTLPVGNGGTGQTSYVNGELLIGNTTGNTLTKATLTQGTGITITNGAGSITIANSGVTSVNGSTGAVSGLATTSGNLSQFAATTSAQLAGVISDETGSGSLVFATSPALSGTPTAPTAAAGTNTTQIATTAFVNTAVDNARQGIDAKESVRVATTANITNLTGGAPNSVDGITLAANDRVLVKNQTTGSQNGIYIVQTLGTGSNGTWVRASDADTSAKVTSGMFTFVEQGTTNADSGWLLQTANPITLGTTSLSFVQFSGAGQIDAGAGLTKTGNQLNVGAGTGISVAADSIAIDTSVVARKFSQTIGNGSLTSITVTHNLGTQDVVMSVREVSTNEVVFCDMIAASTNTATFVFAVAPTSNQYRVTVIG